MTLNPDRKTYDLAQPLHIGVPHFPTHPPFLYSLNKQHGDFVMANGGSSAVETITLGCHTGTHIDALCHFSCAGKTYGGAELSQSWAGGVEPHAADTIQPILRRAVLFDVAGSEGVDALAEDFAIAPRHLERIAKAQAIEPRRGDIALLRTGWGRLWGDPRRYVTGGRGIQVTGPGPEEPAARWLSERGVFAAGSDTLAFERMPSPEMRVHMHLLVAQGIHIIENLNLEQLAAERIYEFLFVALPLKIRGATGSPIRPVALPG
jgi:kynurenine formamidase